MSKKLNITKKFLIKEYITNKKSFNQIAKDFNFSKTTLRNYCKIYHIKSRNIAKYSKILTKKFLIQEYIENKKTSYEISKEIDCGFVTILNYLRKYNIEIIKTIGKNHPNYGNKGKHSYSFKDGRCSQKYYCIDCGKEVSLNSGFYGFGKCGSCATITRNKKLWQNKEYKEKQLKAMYKGLNLHPNKPEKLLDKLLQKFLPNEYKFVGDGKIFIASFCPDFVNKNNNKIIELFGDYWHGLPEKKLVDKRRSIAYKKYGYKTLIIWEHELKDLEKVKNRILSFNKVLRNKVLVN